MNIVIIGAGAAGMMVAATLCEHVSGSTVCLIDRNARIGRKVVISGGGRCNVTTGLRDLRKVMDCYPRGGKFLHSAMSRFSPEDVYDWFETHDVPLKMEDDLRVFPVSNNGEDIVAVFEEIFRKSKTSLRLGVAVERIEKKRETFSVYLNDGKNVEADVVVLTPGGQAYRATGSQGDGYAFAEQLGHHVTRLAPSLNAFLTSDPWQHVLSGVSLERATLSVRFEKKYSFTGPLLFTHRGLTGPAVFALSSMIAFETYDKAHPMELFVDMIPDVSVPDFEQEFLQRVHNNPKKDFHNIVAEYMPHSLSRALCESLSLDGAKNAVEISKKDLHRMMSTLKHLPLHVIGRAAGDEFVTAGGVKLNEVDPKTMQSKICPGLYFAGEILDIDGFTGGFNLQASWATGRLAGIAISDTMKL